MVEERIELAATRAGRTRDDVTLVAVSKTHPPELVREAYRAGARVFGENYAQELVVKQAALGDLAEARWHFIGRLQRNKAKDVAGRVALIHAVDSVDLGAALGRRAGADGRVQDVLVQVNVAGEDTKAGVAEDELDAVLEALAKTAGIRVAGLMTMPPPVVDPNENRHWFRALAKLAGTRGLRELSMGMSGDFEVAIEEGATIVRVGTAIFGDRG
jgi:hypothetical protein